MLRRQMFAALIAAPLLLTLFQGGSFVTAAPAAHPAAKSAWTVLAIINADRKAAGIAPLTFAAAPAQVALAHSLDMAQHNYLSHTGRDGSSPFARLAQDGISYREAGENIGYDTGTHRWSMLHQIEAAMLKSPEHRANLLRSSFTSVGIGVAVVGPRLYVTEDFTG